MPPWCPLPEKIPERKKIYKYVFFPFSNNRDRGVRLGFISAHIIFFCPKGLTLSHASANVTRRHKYFRGLSRLLPVPGVLVSFLELRFLGKTTLLALGDWRPLSPSQKALSKSKGHFYKKMCAINDTKTPELSKSGEGNREYL